MINLFSWAGLKKLLSNKAVQYIIGVATAITLLYQIGDSIYDKGRADERIAIQAEHNKLLEAARKKYEEQHQEALDILAADMQDEIERIKSNQATEDRKDAVIEFIGETIKVPAECSVLVDNITSVFRKARGIANGDTGKARSQDK